MNKSVRDLQLEINFREKDAGSQLYIDFQFTHSRHSRRRSAQRGIKMNQLTLALQYGETIYKQGLIYFILGEDNIPDSLLKNKDKLKNTVVVVAGDSNTVVTCYRSANPFKNIKLKSKKLYHYGYAA
ncbi:MAG: DUF4258 domain-containing protein [Ferruginibacter sp.]